MILEDRHIEYLLLVEQGEVRPSSTNFDVRVAAQMFALGATRVARRGLIRVVELTPLGQQILIEEDEAWA